MSLRRWLASVAPKGFLWKLTLLNTVIIVGAIALSSFAVYHTACFLVEGIGDLGEQRQQQFNATLFQYLWIFSIIGITTGGLLHFYLTKKLFRPIKKLIASTEQLKRGEYPDEIVASSQDEVGELIRQYNGLLQQLQANEHERQRLVSDISHEIRTPLSNLSGYLHALKTGLIEGDKELFHSLSEEANRLAQLINQLELLKEWNSIITKKITKKQLVDISEQINQCVAMFNWKLMRSDIPVKVGAERQEMMLHVEGIQQVLNNLLDNAIRYYTGNGPIVITGIKEDSDYLISFSGPSINIPLKDRDKLFERFYRPEASRNRETGGSGLGLAIVKEIIERHRGQVGVETKEEITTFWVKIPTPSPQA